MHKRAARFEQSTGWGSSSAGGAHKRDTRRSTRSDVSQGSQSMADGGAASNRVINKERALARVRVDLKAGKLGQICKCPFCNCEVGAKNIERHIRRKHG